MSSKSEDRKDQIEGTPKERYRDQRKKRKDQFRTIIDEYAQIDDWDELDDVIERFEPIRRKNFK